jgi:hypothetical protein
MSAEIDDLMSHCAELAEQLLLQTKSTVIGGNSNAHIFSLWPSRWFLLTTKLTKATKGPDLFDC